MAVALRQPGPAALDGLEPEAVLDDLIHCRRVRDVFGRRPAVPGLCPPVVDRQVAGDLDRPAGQVVGGAEGDVVRNHPDGHVLHDVLGGRPVEPAAVEEPEEPAPDLGPHRLE